MCCQNKTGVLPKWNGCVVKINRWCCQTKSATVGAHSQFCSNKVVFHLGKTILLRIINDGDFDHVRRPGPELFSNTFGNTPQYFGNAFGQHVPIYLATRLGNISFLVGDLADIPQGWESLCVEVPGLLPSHVLYQSSIASRLTPSEKRSKNCSLKLSKLP